MKKIKACFKKCLRKKALFFYLFFSAKKVLFWEATCIKEHLSKKKRVAN